MRDAGGVETAAQRVEMQPRDIRVGHDQSAFLARDAGDQRARLHQQACTNDNIVAAGAELDAQSLGFAHGATPTCTPRCDAKAAHTRSSVTSAGPSMLSTAMSASA